MPVLNIPAAILPALSYAVTTIPEAIPSRWEKIANFMHSYLSKNNSLLLSTCIKVSNIPFI